MKFILKFPYCIKVQIIYILNLLKFKRNHYINKVLKNEKSNSKFNKNSVFFRKSLKRFLKTNFYSYNEIVDFLNWLYNDKITCLKQVPFVQNSPIILCVVKNDIIKLREFMKHYSNLGFENFVFIDNDSNDGTLEYLLDNNCTLYQVKEKYTTNRRISWIMNVKNSLPLDEWIFLLDSDEFLVYYDCENHNIHEVVERLNINNEKVVGSVMLDMFSLNENADLTTFRNSYIYFDNDFTLSKSYFFNSIYGGIRKRVFVSKNERQYLIKKHPVIKNNSLNLFCHSHFSYPYKLNYNSKVYFALLHYKFYEKEVEKFKKIVQEKNYANESAEYKKYVEVLTSKKFEEIFTICDKSIEYTSSKTLEKIELLDKIEFM